MPSKSGVAAGPARGCCASSRVGTLMAASRCLSVAGSVRKSVRQEPRVTSKSATSLQSPARAVKTPGKGRKLSLRNASTAAPEDTLHCFQGAMNLKSYSNRPPPNVPTTRAWPSLARARQLGTPSHGGTVRSDQHGDRLRMSQPFTAPRCWAKTTNDSSSVSNCSMHITAHAPAWSPAAKWQTCIAVGLPRLGTILYMNTSPASVPTATAFALRTVRRARNRWRLREEPQGAEKVCEEDTATSLSSWAQFQILTTPSLPPVTRMRLSSVVSTFTTGTPLWCAYS
mmetsp:Transcript_55195/g.152957  ORF Transcript_55195/g.152957 Transcript_55195/m.152957 type:complete len:284 (-) Transcript_55195:32-883(-)